MDIKHQLKMILKEAEIYKSHGLTEESNRKFKEAAALIRKHPDLPNAQKVLYTIEKKITEIYPEDHIHGKIPHNKKMTVERQDIIKNEFSFSGDKDTATLEGAVALARFGQYERSLNEFTKLLSHDAFRVVAAKNILRCHIAISSVAQAINQYEEWVSSDSFPLKQIEKIRVFFEGLLHKKEKKSNIVLSKPNLKDVESQSENMNQELEDDDEEFLDISSIGIIMENGPQKGKVFEYDVQFQSGNTINFIVSGKDQLLIDNLQEGQVLKNVQFYSLISILKSSCVVSSKILVGSGPNRGKYSLDIKVLSK